MQGFSAQKDFVYMKKENGEGALEGTLDGKWENERERKKGLKDSKSGYCFEETRLRGTRSKNRYVTWRR